MSCAQFIGNLEGLNDGQDFHKDLLKVSYFQSHHRTHTRTHCHTQTHILKEGEQTVCASVVLSSDQCD